MLPDSHPADRNSALNALVTRAVNMVRPYRDPEIAALLAALLAAMPDRVPEALVAALRSPVGLPRVVRLKVHGHRTRLLIDPQGHADPTAERRAWEYMKASVLREAAA